MSKRSLYKPAQQDTIAERQKRKPLAQGRLSTHDSTRDQQSVAKAGNHGREGSLSLITSPKSVLSGSPGRPLSQYMTVDCSASLDTSNPRRKTPHLIDTSPPTGPSMFLELSDTEKEEHHSKIPSDEACSENEPHGVLVVDALHQPKNLNDSEIDIELGFEHSPVKVVCHSPSRVHSNLRNTGDVEKAREVEISHVPKILILGGAREDPPTKAVSLFKSPIVVKENTIAGGVRDQFSTAKPLESYDKSDDQHHMESDIIEISQKYPLPKPMLLSSHADSDSSSASSIGNTTSNVSNLSEPGSVRNGQPRVKSVNNGNLKVKKKKKVPRYVESRCTQAAAAAARKGPMKATDRSILSKTATSTVGKKNSTLAGAIPDKKRSNSEREGNTSSSKKKSTPVRFSATPEPKGRDRASSTPTASGVLFKEQEVDISAIGPPGYHLSHHSSGLESSLSDFSQTTHRKQTKSSETKVPEISTQDVDIQYARYLQGLFLMSKAKKEHKEQEKKSMNQLYALWESIEEKRDKKTSMDLMLARLKHVKLVDEALETQSTGLTPVVSELPRLGEQYTTLAQALDISRHQMPTKGVYIPTEQDSYMDEVSGALRESEMLLSELNTMSRQQAGHAQNFSQHLANLDTSIQDQTGQLQRLHDQLIQAQALSTKESSLKVQHIQLA